MRNSKFDSKVGGNKAEAMSFDLALMIRFSKAN